MKANNTERSLAFLLVVVTGAEDTPLFDNGGVDPNFDGFVAGGGIVSYRIYFWWVANAMGPFSGTVWLAYEHVMMLHVVKSAVHSFTHFCPTEG